MPGPVGEALPGPLGGEPGEAFEEEEDHGVIVSEQLWMGRAPRTLTRLRSPPRDGPLHAHLRNLLIAGHLTTTALIGTTLLHLLRDRRQWELLRAEPQRIPAAIEEAVRYDTALQGFRRVTTRPVTLAGTELSAGTPVFLAYGSANRDASRYPRPDDFDIARPAGSRHLSFGFGTHTCPGSQLAREQLRLTLEQLTHRLPGLRLAEGQQIIMRPTLIHRSPERLELVW